MTSEPPPHLTVVWVMVNGVKGPRTQWIYLLSDDEPGSPSYGAIRDRGISTDRLCYSYTELSAWLRTYGFTPPSQDYFAPTQEELDEDRETIVRRVTRPR
jgi:hypothetical protein